MTKSRGSFIRELEKDGINAVTINLSIDNFIKILGPKVEIKRPSIRTTLFWCIAFALEGSKVVKTLDLSGMLDPKESRDRWGQPERLRIIMHILKTNHCIEHLILNRSSIPKGGAALLANALKESSVALVTMKECWFEDVNEVDELLGALEGSVALLDVQVIGHKKPDRYANRLYVDELGCSEDLVAQTLVTKPNGLLDMKLGSSKTSKQVSVERKSVELYSSLISNRHRQFLMPKKTNPKLPKEVKPSEKKRALKF